VAEEPIGACYGCGALSNFAQKDFARDTNSLTGRIQFTNSDRLCFIKLYRWFPSVLKAITIIRPETLVRWHRAGFRRYWRWKSRNLTGRPQISADLGALIRRMSVENLLWGAPRCGWRVGRERINRH
jgi:hypothetical protein